MVRDVPPPDGAEIDRVEAPQDLQAVFSHHAAGLVVVLASPRKLFPCERQLAARLPGDAVQDPLAGLDHFPAHAVGRDLGDLEGLCLAGHAHAPLRSGRVY